MRDRTTWPIFAAQKRPYRWHFVSLPDEQKQSGFTLIELLVVISIIAILAAMLLPALGRAKTQAQQTECVSNVKELNLAGLNYLGEFRDQAFPYNQPGLPGYDPNTWPGWCYALTNFGAANGVLVCPCTRLPARLVPNTAGAADRAWVGDADSLSTNYAVTYSSYGQNGWLTDFTTLQPNAFDGNGYGGSEHPRFMFSKLTSIQKPSQTPFFFDQNYVMTCPLESDSPSSDLYSGNDPDAFFPDGMGCCTLLRHGGPTAGSSVPYTAGQPLPSGGIIMGLADGHAEYSKLNNLWNYTWHLNWNPAAVTAP